MTYGRHHGIHSDRDFVIFLQPYPSQKIHFDFITKV